MAPPKKLFCSRGHLRSDDNLYKRSCRRCHIDRVKTGEKRDWHNQIVRKSHLKSHYGITPQQYSEMFDRQLGLCAICRKPEATKKLAVDHNHTTGEVRGLLCQVCNQHVVYVLENHSNLLPLAKIYLEKTLNVTR